MEMTAAKIRTRDIAYIAIFTALTAVCSWISIPTAIPFTLQTMAVFLAVGLLGGKLWGLGLNMLLGLLVCYAFGTAWFMVVYPMGGEGVGLWTALTWCVFPYVPFDMVKIARALALTSQLRRHVK